MACSQISMVIIEAQAEVSDVSLEYKEKIDYLLQIADRAELSQADKTAAVHKVDMSEVAAMRLSYIPRARGKGKFPSRGFQTFQHRRGGQCLGMHGNRAQAGFRSFQHRKHHC